MTTVSEALDVQSQINKEVGRRMDRFEDDIYGKDGIRVALTELATMLKPIPEKIDALTASVATLKASEHVTKERRTLGRWIVGLIVGAASAVTGAIIERHK